MKDRDRIITVCWSCLRASCWQGVFMCDDSRGADTTRLSVAELKALGLEHSSYWTKRKEAGEA